MTGDNQDVLEFLKQTKFMYDEDSANYMICEQAIAAVMGVQKAAAKLAYIHQCIDLYCDREELHDESYWLDYILDPEWIDTDIGWTGDKMTPNQSEFPTRCDLISRTATIDAVLNLNAEHCVSWKDAVVDTIDALPSTQQEKKELSKWQEDFRGYINLLNLQRDDYNGIMEYIDEVPSAQPEPISEEYAKAVKTWLINYQVRCAEFEGRYMPYEILGWIVNDWRKENGIW